MYKQMLFALAAVTAGSAAAQARPDPADARAKAPPVEYRSAFEGYRPYTEPELAPWRAVNEEVRQVGGHLGIVRTSKPAGHGGHK